MLKRKTPKNQKRNYCKRKKGIIRKTNCSEGLKQTSKIEIGGERNSTKVSELKHFKKSPNLSWIVVIVLLYFYRKTSQISRICGPIKSYFCLFGSSRYQNINVETKNVFEQKCLFYERRTTGTQNICRASYA